MLQHLRLESCPRCDSQLLHEFDLAGDWVLPSAEQSQDQRWVCPSCGYSQPVTYVRDRRPGSRSNPEPSETVARRGLFGRLSS
jgi:transposase-like protein